MQIGEISQLTAAFQTRLNQAGADPQPSLNYRELLGVAQNLKVRVASIRGYCGGKRALRDPSPLSPHDYVVPKGDSFQLKKSLEMLQNVIAMYRDAYSI